MNLPQILFGTLAAAALLSATPAGAQASDPAAAEPGLLLRGGTWGGGVGSFAVPQALESLPPGRWPADGWLRLDFQAQGVRVSAVTVSADGKPVFLRSIVEQIQAAEQAGPERDDNVADTPVEEELPIYLRVPTARLSEGFAATYRFKNGTTALTPLLDHRYSLSWQGRPFSFTVQNGLRNAAGVPYGEGAVYTIEIDGQHHRYHIDGFGWDSRIQAIADIDGDGKPDFFLGVSGSNSSSDVVLLSSQARPGLNPPTATLTSFGC
jgi:hypothetical protein